ncbi:MAG: MFS transporter [Actinobacteria bacterium]|nr:MFS transporter [Actinomycetota bacterium]
MPEEQTTDPYADIRHRHIWGTFFFAIGSSMVSIVTAYIVYQQSGSVAVSGLIVVCSSLPAILLPAPATAIARRWGGPKDYIFSRIAIGIVGFFPVALSISGNLTTASLLVWFLATGVLYALSSPATGLVRAMIAAPGQVPEFNGALAKASASGTIIGLLAGGAIFAAIGSTWVFFIGALVSIVEALSVFGLLGRAPHAIGPRERFREAIAIRRGNRSVRVICMFSAWCFVIGGYSVTLPAIAALIGTNPLILSVLQTAAVVGGLIVGWAIHSAHGSIPWGRVHRLLYIVVAAGIGVLAWAANHTATSADASVSGEQFNPYLLLLIASVAIIPVGFALTMDGTILGSLMQVVSQKGSGGALLSGYAMIPALFVPIGQELIGFASDTWSVSAALAGVAAIALIGVLIGPHVQLREDLSRLSEAEEPPAAPPALPHAGGSTNEGRPQLVD